MKGPERAVKESKDILMNLIMSVDAIIVCLEEQKSEHSLSDVALKDARKSMRVILDIIDPVPTARRKT